MKNLTDGRSESSKENGKSGGRPPSIDFSSVAKILIAGLRKLSSVEEINFESKDEFSKKRIRNKANILCSGFNEVISKSRLEYINRLEKLNAPNPIEVRNKLRKDIDVFSREIREHLRVISVKAEVLLQESDELNVKLEQDITHQLERMSKIEAKSLDKIVELILGIVEEILDRFGIPINS